jgi:hypothetical protein
MPALGVEPLACILDLRLDAGEVHTAQGDQHLMAVQSGFQRDTHWCLWQWHRGRVWLRWCRLAGWLSLVGADPVKLGLGQLLRSSGNRRAQPMFAKIVGRLLIVAAVTVTIDDVVGRRAVALAGHLRRAIRQQLDIAVEDEGNCLVHTAVALWQLGLGLIGDRCYSITPCGPCTEVG